jgi:hypothetical protein
MLRRLAFAALIPALAACSQAPAPVPVSAPPPSPPPRPAAPPPEVPIPQAPPVGEPTDYLNLPPANLRSLLGAPQFVRQDGATELWRYDGSACRAFFFFQGPSGSQTVRHVETLPAGAASAADPLCLNALRASRAS